MCLSETLEAGRRQPARAGTVSRRGLLLGAGAAAFTVATPGAALAGRRNRDGDRVRDLSHLFRDGFPMYVGDPPARRTIFDFDPNGFYAQAWTFGEHSGTHMDAPGHFVLGGRLSPEITPQELIVPVVVIDISARARTDPDAMVTVDDVRSFERGHGRIPDGALVCMNSGWAAKVGDPLAFKGGAAFPNYHFPGFGVDAALWLARERDVTAIGVDTMSLDPGNSSTFPVHVNFLATDRYGLENLNNLDQIPPRGALAYVGLIPWEEGSGGPCRVIANW
jgi:kynurenine formamidase